MRNALKRLVVLIAALAIAWGCTAPKSSGDSGSNAETASNPTPANVNKADYPVFSNPDSGADPAVSADQGGKGFTGQGWQTNTDFDLIGDPRAVKGGVYRESIADFPSTFRQAGPDASTSTNYLIGECVYETLLALDPNTLDFTPSLATHWQVSGDRKTLRFRINPNARFSTGEPVTADDVIASWSLLTDKTLSDPSRNAQFGRFEKPVAESKYIVRVSSQTPDWRNLRDFGTLLFIYPASALKNVNGAAFIEKFNFTYIPGTGPYIAKDADIDKGKSITLRRRSDYWAEKNRRNAGLNNFAEVKLITVLDQALAFEMFKKGELDFYFVNRSQVWIEELNTESVQRGLIQKRKVYNGAPAQFQGFAINTRRPPLDDVRVRKALMLLLNRPKVIEQIYLNEYTASNSFFPGSVYENPANPKNLYNPQEAQQLLAEAGWKDRDSQGRLVRNGKPFVLQMLYDQASVERVLTIYQEDLRKAGITLDLKRTTGEVKTQLARRDRQFDLVHYGFQRPLFPDPESEWHSRLADAKNNNNLTGFKDPHMDELMEKYKSSFDQKEREALLRELDGVMANQYHWVFQWMLPSQRIAFANKFGQPAGYLARTGMYKSDISLGPGPERLWWIDPAKDEKLKKALADPAVKLGVGPTDDKYWLSYKEPHKSQ